MSSPSSSTVARILGPDSDEEVLVEARMGKMIMENRTVKPDTRKGVFRLLRGEGFLRMQWKERTQESPEDDIIVFPHEATFEKVQQSRERVYIMKFKQDERRYFFWMQEPDDKGDSNICATIDYFLNTNVTESEEEDEDQVDIPEAPLTANTQATGISQSMARSTDAAATGAVQLSDLQRILSSITPQAAMAQDIGPSLSDILKPELVLPLLEGCHLDERLTQLLPEGSWTPQALAELMQSPQFHQQVDAFTHVLRSGQIDLSQFGIDSSKYNFTVLSFLEAIDDQVSQKGSSNLGSTSEDTSDQPMGDSNSR